MPIPPPASPGGELLPPEQPEEALDSPVALESRDCLGVLPPSRRRTTVGAADGDGGDSADAAAHAAAHAAAAQQHQLLLRQSQELLLGPRRPRPHKAWRRRYVKLLIVGDSGIGKTTLVRTLLSTPGERLQVHDGSSTPAAQFASDPESLCTTVTWRDEEDRVVWVYRVQDTPGYSDLELPDDGPGGGRAAHAAMIRRYVHAQNAAWLAREQSPDRALMMMSSGADRDDARGPGGGGGGGGGRGGDMDGGGDAEDEGADDPRVDLVLYALPPHRLRAADLRYMAELGRVAPLLPVVCKCDTMTIGEARRFRKEVRDRLVRGFGPPAGRGRAGGAKAKANRKRAAAAGGKRARGSSGGGGGGHGGGSGSGGYAINVFEFDRDTLLRAGLAAASGGGGAGGGETDSDDDHDDDADANDASGARDDRRSSSSRRNAPAAPSAPPVPPFLVVASNDVNDEMAGLVDGGGPVFWPERRYAWGTAEAFNPDHSDLLFLRALLLKEGLEAIVRDKRRRYEAWRREQLTRPRYGERLRSFVVWTAAPVAAVLWWAREPESVARAARVAARAAAGAAGAVARGARDLAARRRRGKAGGAGAAAAAAAAAPPAQASPSRGGGGGGGGLFRGRAAALVAAAPPAVAVEPAAAPRKQGPFGLW
jgi:septin family protein